MTKKNEKHFTRRIFIRDGTRLGTGLLFTPLIVKLTGCSDGNTSAVNQGSGQGGGPDESGGLGSTGINAGGSQRDTITSAGTGAGGAGGRKDSGGIAGASGKKNGSAGKPADAGRDTSSGPTSDTLKGQEVLFGLYSGDAAGAVRQAVNRLDFSWLHKGDSVLIKVASNSGNPHPAVTSPAAVQAMVAEFKTKGASRVIVADQAGVEWVRLSAAGRFSSTRERWQSNGLIAAEGEAEVFFFDDQGFDAGYITATLPSGNHWPRGAYVAKVIEEVNHIVYMPRMGCHQLAGLTFGLKNAIGWLRDDSRHDLHNDAQYFHAKYTEINFAEEIRSRFRLVVTACDKALLHGGPDDGTVYPLDPSLVVASPNLANHDAVVSSIVVALNQTVPNAALQSYAAATAPLLNSAFAGGILVGAGDAGAWVSGSPSSALTTDSFEQGVTGFAAVARAWELSGGAPSSVRVIVDGEPIDATLRDSIQAHGKNLYVFA